MSKIQKTKLPSQSSISMNEPDTTAIRKQIGVPAYLLHTSGATSGRTRSGDRRPLRRND
jgi:hypothetical protein